MKTSPWWKNTRGEWYVVIQVGLFLLVAFGPRLWPGATPWPESFFPFNRYLGGGLMLIGLALAGAGGWHLGRNLTPLPHPKDEAQLVETGAYAWVRHPIYSGLIFIALGWAVWVQGTLTVVYAGLLLIFFDIKSRREERWLREKFPEYAAYQRRAKKLIPGVY